MAAMIEAAITSVADDEFAFPGRRDVEHRAVDRYRVDKKRSYRTEPAFRMAPHLAAAKASEGYQYMI